MIELSEAKRRLVERLKRVDAATAAELAAEFELTDTAVRQHLESLMEAGLVRRITGEASGRGRPPARWQLTTVADRAFPDRHVDLTVELIQSIRTELGEEALERVLGERARKQLELYRRVLGDSPVPLRVRRLAEQRSVEGYVAEVECDVDSDDLLLVEHHCPVRTAAGCCDTLCRTELEVFEAALGADVEVSRVQHLLAGHQRCAYRIRPRRTADAA